MLVDRQRLGEVIRKVVYAGNMLHAELSLADSVLEPVETHIDTSGELRREGPVSQTDSECVVAQNGRRGLGVAQVVQDAALFDGVRFWRRQKDPRIQPLGQRNIRRECGRNCRRLAR